MDLQRFFKHLLVMPWRVRRAFPPASLAEIAQAISAAEQQHAGEIRFVVEGALEPGDLFRGLSSRERAVEVFSELRVWDTEHNNGVLIYVLLADHAVEILADRGIYRHETGETWSTICHQIEEAFRQQAYEAGALKGIAAVARSLRQHFPKNDTRKNELPNEPVLL